MSSVERKTLTTNAPENDLLTMYQNGFLATMVIRSAVRLEIFDELGKTPGGATAASIAQSKGWSEAPTARFLNSLVSVKTLTKSQDAESGVCKYRLDGLGRRLMRKADPTIFQEALWITRMGDYSGLEQALKSSGTEELVAYHDLVGHAFHAEDQSGGHGHGHGHAHSHGHDHGHDHGHGHSHGHGHGHSHGHSHGDDDDHGHGEDSMTLEERIEVSKSMAGGMQPYARDLVTAFDLSGFKTAVDLGGGSGVLSFALCRVYPSMHVTLLDMESETKMTQDHLMPKDEKLNISFLSGDFFQVDLPKSDLFLISKVIHHYSTEDVKKLFQRVYDSTNPGGAFVILEKFQNDAKDGPLPATAFDLMLMSMNAGWMGSVSDYDALLKAVGYKRTQVAVGSDTCHYDVMISWK